MSIQYTINEKYDGIEIKFTEKPTSATLTKLKKLGFRWHPGKCVWYAKNTAERLAFAEEIKSDYEQLCLFPTDKIAEDTTEVIKVEKVEEVKKAEKVIEIPKKQTSKKVTKTETKTEKKTEKKADNVIEFAKARPDIKVRMALEENATIEECEAKINEAKKVFLDSDSTFVLDGLLEMCKVNANFRNNFMREGKTYEGAFAYFMNLARQGYAHTFNGVAYMDNNLALGMAMDYFNMVD